MNNQKTCGDGNAENCPGCWQCFEEHDMERKFKCEWNDAYVNAKTVTNRFHFFSTDLGYDQDDIDMIDDLQIGDRYIMSGPMGVEKHTVTRTA